ncbi:unnamed protein product [Closterium sp. NIES-54]
MCMRLPPPCPSRRCSSLLRTHLRLPPPAATSDALVAPMPLLPVHATATRACRVPTARVVMPCLALRVLLFLLLTPRRCSKRLTLNPGYQSPLPADRAGAFRQVETGKDGFDAITACYPTPSTTTLGRLIMPFLFHDVLAFSTVTDLITHLRLPDASFTAALTPAELASQPPPPMYLSDRLVPSRDALLAMHPYGLMIVLFVTSLIEIETCLRTNASTTGTVAPNIFQGCAPPQLPTSAASVDVAEPNAPSVGPRGAVTGGAGTGGAAVTLQHQQHQYSPLL